MTSVTIQALLPVLVLLLPSLHVVLGVAFLGRRISERLVSLSSSITYAIAVALLTIEVLANGPLELRVGDWARPFGITLVADALTVLSLSLFALVNLGCVIYALGERDDEVESHAYHPLFQVMVLGASGAALSRDLFNLYVWFEVILVASFVLMVFGRSPQRMKAALVYVTINLTASSLYLAAVAMFYSSYGTLDLQDLGEQMRLNPEPWLEGVGWALLMLFFLVKMAAFPFFSWLPTSYPQPPIAVGAFFGGILTKIAFVVLVRLAGQFSPEAMPFGPYLYWVGVLTLFSGISAALVQDRLRRVAAWLLAGEMGYLMLTVSVWDIPSIAGSLFMMLHMAVATTALFLLIGIIERVSGSQVLQSNVTILRAAPFAAALFGVVAAAVSGFPPTSGFVAKLLVIQSILPKLGGLGVFFVLAASFISIAVMGRVWALKIWAGKETKGKSPAGFAHYAACVGLVGVTVALSVAASPIHALCVDAATELLRDPGSATQSP